MASIYDAIIAQLQSMPVTREDYNAAAFNPNDVNPSFKGPADPIWSALPGQNFYQPGTGADGAPSMDREAMWKFLADNNMQWKTGSQGNRTANWIEGPGGLVEGSVNYTEADDSRFRLAALAAMGVTGANIWAAGVAPAATAPASGAQTFPVATQAADVTTQLGTLAGEATAGTAGTAGGVNLGAGTATAADFGMIPTASGAATYGGVGAAEAVGSAAAGSGAFDWSSLLTGKGARSLFDIASGLYGMKLSSDARKASDPFAKYRGGYGEQLAALEANPNLITQRPGWLAGTELINRTMASRGYTGSGNEKAALSRYAGDFYTQEANRLAGLAGAGQTPGAGQFASAQLASQALGSIGYGIAPWLPNKS